jgi:hypothetical protein
MAKAKWIETSHTDGWFILKAGRKDLADVRRVFPRKRKTGGYTWKYMAVAKYTMAGGMPGMIGKVFSTKRAAMAYAEQKVGV